MFSHPELGSDPPIGSDRESGRDKICDKSIPCRILESKLKFKMMLVSLNSRSEGGRRKTVV